MRKFMSIGGRQLTIIITAAILGALAAVYYFVYIPNKESDLYEEHFSWLQRSDKNIRDKISATDSLLSHLLQLLDKKDPPSRAKKISYIQQNLLGPHQSFGVSKARQPKIDLQKTHFFIEADSSLGRFVISASMKQQGDSIVASMWYNFDEFFMPVLDRGSFEHHVVFFKGRYIYEDFRSGLGYKARYEDSLLRIGPWMSGACVIDQEVGGVPYKMFLQPINLFGRDRLIVAGLHSKKKFDAEKKQLPPDKMMLAIILALGILLFFPWIRIYFLGKYDRLTLGDAVESLLVAKFLMAVLFLFFFKYIFTSRSPDSQSRKVLSNKISSAFHDEIESAYQYLGRFDTSMPCDELKDIINLGKPDSIRKNRNTFLDPRYVSLDKTTREKLNDLYKRFGVVEINWMDSVGNILQNWTTSNRNNAPGNYGDRDYFRNIKEGRVIRPGLDTSVAFTIEPVISWTSGEFRTVICRKSKLSDCSKKLSPHYVLMDWTMKSMDGVIMPAGYSFAIIDAKGEVKYHSDKRKNLNENLLAEFSNNKELQEVLHGGYKEEFNTHYYEESYSVSAEPIKSYPYFIVIMSSSEFPNGVDVETFAFSWGMMLIFLIVVLIDLFIFVVSSGRRSMFRKQSLVTSWLWPRESSQNEYLFASVAHVIVIIALVFSLPSFTYLAGIFVLLLCVPLLTIFLNQLFVHKYKVIQSKWYERYKDRCSRYCVGFFILVNLIAAWLLRRNYIRVLKFQEALIAIGILLFFIYWLIDLKRHSKDINHKDDSKNDNELKKYRYLNWFTFMALTRLIITSGIPIVFFYTSSYNFEQNLLARNRQYDYASQLRNKFPGQASLQSAIKTVQFDNSNYSNAIYTDGKWVNSLAIVGTIPKQDTLSPEDTTTAELFNRFGSYFEYISGLDNDNFYLSLPSDSAFRFNNFFKDVLCRNSGNKLYLPLTTRDTLQLTTAKLNYVFPPLWSSDGFLSWFLLLVAMLIFFIILYDIVQRVCSIDTRKVSTWEVAADHSRKLISSKLSFWMVYAIPEDLKNFLSNNIGIAHQPGQNSVGPPRIIDFDEIKLLPQSWNQAVFQALNCNNPNVCLLHIENRLKDEDVNSAKLECIRSLLSKDKRIIIISAMHPVYFREMLNAKAVESTVESYDHAIGNLPVIIKPLLKNGNLPTEEYSHTDFLWNLHLKLSFASEKATQKAKKELAYDELVLQEQSVSHNFYTEIWESLSTDEKFILYDLAEDGLVNIKNRFAVNLLVNKGLICNDNGHLHLFNRSFRHFIVSATSKEGMKTVEVLRKKRSNWSNLKKPLLVIVIAIFIFFGISQESMYKNFVAILGGITAGIPILLKLLSMFDIQNDRQAKNGEAKAASDVA